MSRRPGPEFVVMLSCLMGACTSGGARADSASATLSSGTDTGTDSGTDTDTDTNTDTNTDSPTDTGPDTAPNPEDCMMTLCEDECVDLESASSHCGSCGFDCLGGECVDGKCGPVEIAANKGRLFMVEVDDDHVYYGGDGVFLGRMNKDGTDNTVIESNSEICLSSAVTPNTLVWGSQEAVGLRGCFKPDCLGGVIQFYDGGPVAGLHFNKLYNRLFWSQGGNVLQRDWPGGMLGTLASNQGQILQIEGDNNYIYWLTEVNVGDRRVRRIDILGQQPVEQIVGPNEIVSFAVGPTQVFWSEAQFIYAAPLDGSPASPNPFAQALEPVRRLAVDDMKLYWLAGSINSEGYVERCSVEVCTVSQTLATPSRPWGLAFDDEAVYWVTETGSIAKHRK